MFYACKINLPIYNFKWLHENADNILVKTFIMLLMTEK